MNRRSSIKLIGAGAAAVAAGVSIIPKGISASVLRVPAPRKQARPTPAQASVDPVQQFFDRLLTPPTGVQADNYAQLINGLYADGTWALLDGLYILAALDEGTAFTNLISDNYRAYYPLDNTYFTSYQGIEPVDGTSYVSLNFQPSIAGGNFGQNSACLFAWNLLGNATGSMIGTLVNGSTQNCCVIPYTLNADTGLNQGHSYYGLNSLYAGKDAGPVAADASGFFLSNRSGANAITFDVNGTEVDSDTTASRAPDSGTIELTGISAQIAVAGFGGSLTPAQRSSLYQRLSAYLQGVGAV